MNEHIRWAVERWEAEVKHRSLDNVHRRTLDDTWRQVIRHFGGDDEGLCGPAHDELLASSRMSREANDMERWMLTRVNWVFRNTVSNAGGKVEG